MLTVVTYDGCQARRKTAPPDPSMDKRYRDIQKRIGRRNRKVIQGKHRHAAGGLDKTVLAKTGEKKKRKTGRILKTTAAASVAAFLILAMSVSAVGAVNSVETPSVPAARADHGAPVAGGPALEAALKKSMQPALKKDAYPEVAHLVNGYYASMSEGDTDAYAELVDSVSEEDKARLIRVSGLIGEYSDITCYTKPGPEEGSYFVFARYSLKLMGIKTPAPGLSLLYAYPDAGGKLKILNKEATAEVLAAAGMAAEGEDVEGLKKEVQADYEAAVASDEALAELEERYQELMSDAM